MNGSAAAPRGRAAAEPAGPRRRPGLGPPPM